MNLHRLLAAIAVVCSTLFPGSAGADERTSDDGKVALVASACKRVPPVSFRIIFRQHPAWVEKDAELQEYTAWYVTCAAVVHTDYGDLIIAHAKHRGAKRVAHLRREVARRCIRLMYALVDDAWVEEERKRPDPFPALLVPPRGYTVP